MRTLTIIILIISILSCNNTKQDNKAIDRKIISDTIKRSMTDTLKTEVLEQINTSIKSGFYDKDDIFNNVEDYLYEIPYDKEWTKLQIENIYAARVKEQESWEAVTDFDKLVQTFDKLNSNGIISLHNAGMTKQDGESDCQEIYQEQKKNGIVATGFCYYHWQDIERVVEDGNLFIGFGDFKDNDKDALVVGNQIASTLESVGLKLNWDKTVKTRIEIINLKWQKRFGNDNCSNDRAVKKLRNKKTD
jgi:hypothetical protein